MAAGSIRKPDIHSLVAPSEVAASISVTELAAAVSAVETGGGVLRAVGSNWSYTEVALTRIQTQIINAGATYTGSRFMEVVVSPDGDPHLSQCAGREH